MSFGLRWNAAVGAFVLMAVTACAASTGRVYVHAGPPRAVVERRVVAPGPGYVWQSGFYRWNGRAYVWTPGHYERAPRGHAAWVPGRWAHDRRGWYFIEGHWR